MTLPLPLFQYQKNKSGMVHTKTTDMILEELQSYANPKTKLSRMVKQGKYFQIARGLYETDKNVSEAVYTITSATFEKKKKKKYETAFGTFTYRDVPSAVFPLNIRLIQEGNYFYRIAEPEKALCDQLYTMPPAKNIKLLAELLFDDLRIEETELLKLEIEKIVFLSDRYHSTNIKKLITLLKRIKDE